jgi:hypothetical protein
LLSSVATTFKPPLQMSTITYTFNVYAEGDYDSGQDGEYEIDPDYYDVSIKGRSSVKLLDLKRN